MTNYYELVDANKLKSNLVILGFVTFIALAAYFIGYSLGYGWGFVGYALIISGIAGLTSYYYSDKIILTLSSAKPAKRSEHFNYYTVTENLSKVAGIPMPALYVIDDTAMNAFATGRDPSHAVIVATTGILAKLNRTELEGVIGHELSHVKNYDIRLMGIVTILIGIITLMADYLLRFSFYGRRRDRDESGQLQALFMVIGLVLALLSPLIAQLIKLAISRRREFLADAYSAQLTKYPEGLAHALEKLSHDREPLEAANKATAHLYIVNPLKNHHDAVGWFAGLFNTHPPIGERVRALRS
ncbi:zinc metalloprotease HtpX [Candidatus Collierbacteria bacterium RIFCSPLOWO2_01_FULL_50_23]|uniref:Protease HtpX homolog n=2 Tax=Candidatus Collieribacteriota TaxID=1752725 RepID=A0A1F5ES45_9BACT|nr:MAG: zinc metalloprotease HtpX [Candidatus Collierbacteria bacterium RIFCSPHIGHO2_02_FULL_49_10]OGD71409.1 MAG: zinc metalloprotease HtpX [Candidatus Collierbacteria bacterium RIFCSPHIGHO2_01_FULL_50_25]OGD74087.1 MAG: zinc metalloprotease HtpX [Candidatus Collierbacteria bacterium RIFCSPLOWO2_01_FULL_50_23]